MTRILIDTNVLVYAYDRSEPVKQRQALALLDHSAYAQNAAITTQVLAEFCAVTLRKLVVTLTPAQVDERVAHFAEIFTVLPVTVPVLRMGLRGVQEYNLSFWDAQIWAAARLYGMPLVLSEDFNPGATLEGVHFQNPFAVDFALPGT